MANPDLTKIIAEVVGPRVRGRLAPERIVELIDALVRVLESTTTTVVIPLADPNTQEPQS